jgi:hypothetical protein
MVSGDPSSPRSSGNSRRSRPTIFSGEYLFSRSCSTFSRSTRLLTSLATLGRDARSYARACAAVARYRPCRSTLRSSSREIVDALRPSRTPIERIDSPAARPTEISSRSANVRQRPFSPRPRRGRTSPASTRTRRPVRRLVSITATASVMKPPSAITCQNRCNRSGRMKIEYSATGNTQSVGVAITARTQACPFGRRHAASRREPTRRRIGGTDGHVS